MLGAPNVGGAMHLGFWVCLVVLDTNVGGAMHLGLWFLEYFRLQMWAVRCTLDFGFVW